MPALAIEYPSTPESARRAAIEEMFTIEPEAWRPMTAPNRNDGMSVPWRLSRSTSSRASTGTSNAGRLSLRARATLPPAALTRMSTRPRASSSWSRACSSCPSSSTSAMSTEASPPSRRIAAACASAASRRRPRIATAAPARAKPAAMAPPSTP